MLVVLARVSIGGAALSITVLHGFEGLLWAVAFQVLGALPDRRIAMLYSLNAMTSYGHVNMELAHQWQLLGALEEWLDSFGHVDRVSLYPGARGWSQSPDRIASNPVGSDS